MSKLNSVEINTFKEHFVAPANGSGYLIKGLSPVMVNFGISKKNFYYAIWVQGDKSVVTFHIEHNINEDINSDVSNLKIAIFTKCDRPSNSEIETITDEKNEKVCTSISINIKDVNSREEISKHCQSLINSIDPIIRDWVSVNNK